MIHWLAQLRWQVKRKKGKMEDAKIQSLIKVWQKEGPRPSGPITPPKWSFAREKKREWERERRISTKIARSSSRLHFGPRGSLLSQWGWVSFSLCYWFFFVFNKHGGKQQFKIMTIIPSKLPIDSAIHSAVWIGWKWKHGPVRPIQPVFSVSGVAFTLSTLYGMLQGGPAPTWLKRDKKRGQ